MLIRDLAAQIIFVVNSIKKTCVEVWGNTSFTESDLFKSNSQENIFWFLCRLLNYY